MKLLQKIYWQVGDRSTYSKAEALLWAKGDLNKISLYFFDKEWRHKNWSSPPTKPLEYLIHERCQSLRDQTKHLCLWLSSGYDSVTILNKCAKFNIMLDELVVISRRKDDPEFPLARKIADNFQKIHQPRVKITEVHLDYNYHGAIYKRHQEDFLLLPGLSLRFSKSLPTVMCMASDTALSVFNNLSDRIDLCGFDKPRLSLRNNQWYAVFADAAVYDFVGSRFTGFWIDTDAFDLYHATCWSAMAWFESLPECSHSLVHKIQSNDPLYYPRWSVACGRDSVDNFYSHRAYGKSLHTNSLGSLDSVKLAEYWIKEDPKLYYSYVSGVKIIQNVISDFWPDINQPLAGVTVNSKSHYLKDLSDKALMIL